MLEIPRKSAEICKFADSAKQKKMISKELFIDNISRKFVPYKGYCKVLEDGTEIIDDQTKDSEGPFQKIWIYPEFPTSHLSFNLKDKDGNMVLPKSVRKISYYDEGYYLLEDNNEDELSHKYAGTGSFPSKEYVSSMNVMRNDGTLLSDKWYKEIIPDLGFLRVTYDGKRWKNVKLSGEPFIVERYILKFGCYIAPSSHGYAIYNSLNEKITADYKSVIWADKGLWAVKLLYQGQYQTFLHGQGDAIINYAHEVLIKTNVIAMLEKDGIWYIFDSLGRTTECLRWNPEY